VKNYHLIIGAGPTGLGAARQLELNASWMLLEAAREAGGNRFAASRYRLGREKP